MTTSDPQAGRRDDDSREHRSIGQRIRDAVLGDPVDEQHDGPAGGGYADREAGHRADAPVVDQGEAPGEAGYAQPAGGYTAPRSDPADPDGTYAETDRRPDAGHDAGYADRERGLEGAPGYADGGRGDAHRTDVASGADYADPRGGEVGRGEVGRGEVGRGEVGRDAGGRGADHEYAPYEQAMREHAQGDEHLQGGRVPDPVRDDVTQDGVARPVDDRGGYTDRDTLAAPTAGQGGAGYDDRTERSGAAYADTRTDTAPGDRDLVTSSYDPDRDSGYDPHAAGTAMTGPGAAGAVRDRDDLDDRDVRGGQARDYDTRGYDPATDTGYADQSRVDTDRATGRGDADYDTGRVDAGERDSGHGPGAGTAAAVAGGAVAAAAGVAAHRRRDDRSDDRGDDHRAEGRFSDVDDTATVDPTPTGRATPDTAGSTEGSTVGATTGTIGDTAAADRRAEAVADEADESHSEGGRERLVPAERAHEYSSRWDALKGDFVDEPRRAVTQADQLVGEVLDDIQRLFTDQRRELDEGFDRDQASTEDLRLALRRYRSFFDRLLSL